MAKFAKAFLGWLTVAVLLAGCAPLFAGPEIPTALPGAINLFVAQTAAAAGTQTALLAPPTLTPSFTPFPTKTASPTVSPTSTFIFVLATATQPTSTKKATTVPTFRPGSAGSVKSTKTAKKASGGGGGGGGGGGSKPPVKWACNFLSQLPTNNTSETASSGFTATWTVQNTSDRGWTTTTVDEVVTGGTVMTTSAIYDVTADTGVGSTYVVSIPMTAPSSPGTYTTAWSLKVGKTLFCPISLTIVVP